MQLRILGRRERVVALNLDEEVSIGKAPGNTIVIDDDPGISARHLTLSRSALGVVVLAPGSSNGTWTTLPGQHEGGARA